MIVFVALALAVDPAAGERHFAACAACHGADGAGNAALFAPAIAGQEPWYLARQLRNFRRGMRGADAGADAHGATMATMALSLPDDAAVDDVAAYVTALPPHDHERTLPGDPEAGAALYVLCGSCHGADGHGRSTMDAPSLVIQQDWYIRRQLDLFRTDVRGAHPGDAYGARMRPMAATLSSDQAVLDVVAYISTLD